MKLPSYITRFNKIIRLKYYYVVIQLPVLNITTQQLYKTYSFKRKGLFLKRIKISKHKCPQIDPLQINSKRSYERSAQRQMCLLIKVFITNTLKITNKIEIYFNQQNYKNMVNSIVILIMVILASLQSFILKVTRNVNDIVNANIKSDFPTNKNDDESCRVRKTIFLFYSYRYRINRILYFNSPQT